MFWRCGAVLCVLASTALGQGGPPTNGLSSGSAPSNLSSQIFPPSRNLTSIATSSSSSSSGSNSLSSDTAAPSTPSSSTAPSPSSSSIPSDPSLSAPGNESAANLINPAVTTSSSPSTAASKDAPADTSTNSTDAVTLISPSSAALSVSSASSAPPSPAENSSNSSSSSASDGSPFPPSAAFAPQVSKQISSLVPSGTAQTQPGIINPGPSDLTYGIVSLLSSAVGPINLPSGVLSPPPLPPPPPILSPPSIPGLTLSHPGLPTPVGPGTTASPFTSSYPYTTNSTLQSPSSGATGVSSKPPQPTNTTCGGTPTLNVLDASLDWWWEPTYTFAVSTFVTRYAANGSSTGWSLAPAPTLFNISSALAEPTCTWSVTVETYPYRFPNGTVTNETYTFYEGACAYTPPPEAASTTFITQTAFSSLTATTGQGTIPSVAATPTPPAVSIGNSTAAFSSGTPFVFFSAYEIVSSYPTMQGNGRNACAEVTSTYNMATPFSFAYEGPAVNGSTVVNAGVTGDVNPAFLGVVNITNAVAGSWVAAPTVVIIVEDVVANQVVPAALTFNSQTILATPTPTLPPNISPGSPTTYTTVVVPPPQTESTQVTLQLPSYSTATTSIHTGGLVIGGSRTNKASLTIVSFTARLESTQVTLDIAVPPSQSVVTANFQGHTVTATALANQSPPATNGGGLGHLISAIVSAAQPTNALQVLSEALHPGGSNSGSGGGSGSSAQPVAGPHSIGGSTSNQTPGAAANIPQITVGSQTFTANAATQFSLGPSATLTPGGIIVVGGTTISLANGASEVVINGNTETLRSPAVTPAPQITIAGTVYQANDGSTYDIAGQLLTPGGIITANGVQISLEPGASAVVVNGKTTVLGDGSPTTPNPNQATITAPPLLTVDGRAYGANGGTSYVISGQTLTPGGEITITGPNGAETISLNAAVKELFTITNGVTRTSMIGLLGAVATGAPILTVDGQEYSAISYDTGSGPTYVIDGHTLTRGGEITISGPHGLETISLEAAGTAIVEIGNGHTTTSTIQGAYGVLPTSPPVLTIGGETFTAINNGATYIIDGQTLMPGEIETLTIGGHTFVVSLAPQATLLVIMEEGPNGQITATELETLFPAQMTGSTVTDTVNAGAGATMTSPIASATGSGASTAADLQNTAPPDLATSVSGVMITVGSLVLAIWL